MSNWDSNMRYTLAFILISAICAFSQERIIDTVYTNTHKVTYVVDTLNTATENGQSLETKSETTTAVKDTFGMSAPPNNLNKTSLLLIAQNLSFVLSYERHFADFWSFAIRFGYAGFDNMDIQKNTDAKGRIYTFSTPLILRWYWGRRNTGEYNHIDASGKNNIHPKSQIEAFLQAQVTPIYYNVDLHRDSSQYESKLYLKGMEFTAFYTFGIGANYCFQHFFFGSEINIGSYFKRPKFQEQISVSNSGNNTRLLKNVLVESSIAIGWMF